MVGYPAQVAIISYYRALHKASGEIGDGASGRRGAQDHAYHHLYDMVNHMKTTLNVDDAVMLRLKREAARRGCTMSELVELALRSLLDQKPQKRELPPLPSWDFGGAQVDIADRNALYEVMEE